MVQPGAEDDHGAAVGFLGVGGELAGDMDDVLARHAGDVLGPGRGKRLVLVVVRGDVVAAQVAVQAVVGAHQIEHRGDQRVAVLQRQAADRDVARQHVGMVGRLEAVGGDAAEIRES